MTAPGAGEEIQRFEVAIEQDSQITIGGEVVQWFRVAATRTRDVAGTPVLEVWARINLEGPTHTRELQVFGTGERLPSQVGSYVGTAIHNDLPNGRGVWHLFDMGVAG